MAACADRATLDPMEPIAGIAIALAAALIFALMAWAGQHQT
jgi:hypothetical protein